MNNNMIVSNIYTNLALKSFLDMIIVSPLLHPDSQEVKTWSENSLKSYAELIKSQQERGIYGIETKDIIEFLSKTIEENK